MRALSAGELLDVWERGQGSSFIRRALLLLSAAYPDAPVGVLEGLSIGLRDSCLLSLRERTFGSKLVGLVNCPRCSEKLELIFDVADIKVAPPILESLADRREAGGLGEALSVCIADYEVVFRLPNSLDLIEAAGDQAGSSRQRLFERCLLEVHHNGGKTPADQLPTQVVSAVIERMASADPQADVRLSLVCPECIHQWEAIFDIVAFFWSELDAWAQRTLHEVHILARTFGWREADILALSPFRRQCYLEMVNR